VSLTPRKQLFISNYLKTKNATKSARAAGYAESSCSVTGSRLLKDPSVAAALAAHAAKSEKSAANLAERVVAELKSVAFSNLQDCFDPETGKLLPINKMSREAAASLTAFESNKDFQKIKTGGKHSALELLAKICQLVKQEQETKQNVVIVVNPSPVRPDPALQAPLVPDWNPGEEPLLPGTTYE